MDTIASFHSHTSDDKGPTTSYDSPESSGIAYLLDVVARFARERRSIRPNVVRIVNDIDILVVTWVGGNALQVAPKCMMMNSKIQPIMIDKRLGHELCMTADDLIPCPFTIVIFIGHME